MPRNSMHPAMQKFRILMPAETHRAPASCRDVDCDLYLHGWMMLIGVGSEQETYLRANPRRLRYRVQQQEGSTTILEFIFEPGQRCFDADNHSVLNGREPFYLHETSGGRRVHTPEGFMEHAHEQIEKNIGLEDRRA